MKIKHFIGLFYAKSSGKKRALLMKLSLSIYLLGCLQLMAINTFSQDKISLELSNVQLHSILEKIEEQTTYSFVYNNDEIDENETYNINVDNEYLSEALKQLFRDTSIQYSIRKKHVILSGKKDPTSNGNFTISGEVREADTGETLLGATILVVGQNKGTVSNEYGFYSLTLPEGQYKIQFSYIGYENYEVNVDLTEDKKMNVDLKIASNALDEVVITSPEIPSKSQVATIHSGVSTLKAREIKKIPALLGEADVTRAILTQPGVSTVGEGATGFNVRGGNIDQNLILLDEAPVYSSSHVWGLFSVFNTDAIKDIKLYKGGIPSRYGGRASSVLAIRQKEGSNKKFKGEGGLGLLFSRLTLEGPIKKEKLSFLVSGRRSYFDLFFPLMGDDIKNSKVYFYDLNTKISWDINENNKLFASGYFGADVMKLKFDEEKNEDGTVEEQSQDIDFQWKNATATLRWNHIFSNKLFMNVSGIYSRYDYSLDSDNEAGGGAGSTGAFKWTSSVENWIFKPDFTFFQNVDTQIRFGVNGTLYQFTPAKVEVDEDGLNEISFQKEKGLEIAPYAEYERKWGVFSLNAGIRYSWFGNLGPYDVASYDPDFPKSATTITGVTTYKKGEIIEDFSGWEPRLSLKWDIKDNAAVKVGYNRMFQYVHLISNTSAALPFDIWKPSGPFIKPLEVNQVSAGYAYDTRDRVYNFSVEGYYKDFNNIVEYKNGADLFLNENLETQLLTGEGYSFGTEFGVYKNRGKLTGNLNYTYSETRRKTKSEFASENINDGKFYPSNYDKPHMLNMTANYKLGEKWTLGTFFTYQTGRPTTRPTGRLVHNGTPYLTYSSRNAFRISDTHRLDISFTYAPKHTDKRWKSSWSFGVYNVYANKNAFSEYSTFKNNNLKTFRFSLIGAPIPFVTYNFKF
ncbi:TonB-dependent receptor [Aquimarina sp. TRL1]|uniref:TonB-dependent receptor n=1 Tax=Aquimarina sp. (strain TRL1) TaxID=2736252 RepID=UPI00158C7FAF|nr:TonB-dependent receptor [Aquimarina sp. TRL1]QKX03860.1 TonB-dependent receptor [Aquimarina sp. TRL1]